MPRWLPNVMQGAAFVAALIWVFCFTYIGERTAWDAGFWIGVVGGSLIAAVGVPIKYALTRK